MVPVTETHLDLDTRTTRANWGGDKMGSSAAETHQTNNIYTAKCSIVSLTVTNTSASAQFKTVG